MKNPAELKENNILRPEEIAFLLRSREQRGTDAVLAAARRKKACFSGREEQISAAFVKELKTFLRTPPAIRTDANETAPAFPLAEETYCFRLEVPGEEAYCLLNKESAGILVAAAFANPHAGPIKMKSLSLAIVKKYMDLLTTAICRTFSLARPGKSCCFLPAPSFDETNFASFGIRLDICGKEAKLNLCFKVPHAGPITTAETFGLKKSPAAALTQSLPDGKITLFLRTTPQLCPLTEILNWRPGTFFPLGIKASDPAELTARGLKPVKVSVGRKGTRIAAKLITKVIGNDTN